MARQAGPFFIVGHIDGLVFYKLGDKYYVRQASEPTSTTRKRLKDSTCYPLMHLRQQEFGLASRLASNVYRSLPKAKRGHGVQGKLTQIARRLLREGKGEMEVQKMLLPLYLGEPVAETNEESTTLTAVPPQQSATPATKKKAGRTALSRWQVSGKGRLNKRRTLENKKANQQEADAASSSLKVFCTPCCVMSLQFSVRPDSG